MIPEFRDDGYLPIGLHPATEAEVSFRFGTATRQRQRLTLRLRRWLVLARCVNAKRFLVDGSFVTAKRNPVDVDAVIWIPSDFATQLQRGNIDAIELDSMLVTRRPEELFAAEDGRDWDDWVNFFIRTREFDERRKGIVEILL
ncbi:hypothetical protein LF1_44030 [Rubripirellula obstinata]|uniref:Polymerase nucleotidyl transferase domain-containing protein n=1 Tax=Rubripirellula obstinata TaxID=406547 RepID=A0A5B1CNA3_9BACT|nr:hypothetical protein [Rubripirellula obstinata]KAA1261842.1 hypothetical protein LF1_44030 [Rubripirellula obstinata]